MNHLELLQVYHFDKKIRCGTENDGGYVIGILDGEYDCYISAGIGSDDSFSRDFLKLNTNLHKSNCFAFDGTIHDYPYQFTTEITFIKKNIGCINNAIYTNLHDIIEKYDNIFLKMDIEGGEFPWLFSLCKSQLKKFKQIVIEVHGITNNDYNCDYNDKIKCLQKIANTHYIIHAHGNNFGNTVNNIPYVIELTYVNKDYFTNIPEFNKSPLPIPNLDSPNNSEHIDIDLNVYPFVNI